MKTYLRPMISITLATLAACSGNKLDVGNVADDAGTPSDVGGSSGGSTGPGDPGAGGSGGTSGGSSASGDRTACPFVASPKPITLGTILGAGKSPSTGTIYVVDQADSLQRVFVSGTESTSDPHQILKRQRVGGSGTGPDFMVFSTGGPEVFITLQIDTPAGQPKRMGVFQGSLKDQKTFVIGQDGEELTILADSEIANMPVRNLPGTVTTEYAASTDDGNFMLVTRPTDDWTYSDFRLFFGPASAMAERTVSTVTRAQDGGSTQIVFNLDGTTAAASFPVIFADGGFAPGPATLTIGTQVSPLTRLSTPPADAQYVCKGAIPQCRWPAAVEPKDAGADNQCRAARFLVTCDLGNGTISGGLRDDLSGCSNNCADNEYGVACGSVGPSSSPMPTPPAGCHSSLPTPAGIIYYCCPCL